jgi:Domain of unknown function (DUF4410)
MNTARILCVAALAALLTGCASSVSTPTAIAPLTTEQKAALRLSDISADAAGGVAMSDGDFGLICQKVRAYIQAQSPGVFADQNGALKMKIHFTRFDRGNAFARAMLIGLGQIVIEADVSLEDAGGKTVAQYKVSKDFALGGMAGAATTVDDVEDGFAKSVATVVK